MAWTQSEPPEMKHAAPKWFHEYIDKLREWLMDNQVIAEDNTVTITSAPGGGLWIRANPPALSPGTVQGYWSAAGQIILVTLQGTAELPPEEP